MADATFAESDEIQIDQDEEYEFSIAAFARAFSTNQAFVAAVRLALASDARRRGNTLDRWAQAQPAPKAVQPNTVQRVF